MITKQLLLQRLEQIGQSIAQDPQGLALLALGSVGLESQQQRLDEYSDLDFFVLVAAGHKQRFIADLTWLSSIEPISYQVRNTVDGYKLLFAGGIFCEFAVFEPAELAHIPFSEGRWVWIREGVDNNLRLPQRVAPVRQAADPDWLLGELLTNLYVGLGRFARGEKLSALRFVQSYAVDRVLDLVPHIEANASCLIDEWAGERRLEQQYPQLAAHLPAMQQGYDKTPESALAILAYIEAHFAVNAAIKAELLKLCSKTEPQWL